MEKQITEHVKYSSVGQEWTLFFAHSNTLLHVLELVKLLVASHVYTISKTVQTPLSLSLSLSLSVFDHFTYSTPSHPPPLAHAMITHHIHSSVYSSIQHAHPHVQLPLVAYNVTAQLLSSPHASIGMDFRARGQELCSRIKFLKFFFFLFFFFCPCHAS